MITFYLNGQPHEISQLNPNTTVLEYLRLHARQMDTKEGCGSGDCGACTVMAQRLPASAETPVDSAPFYTLNACITLLSLMDNHHIMTAAYLADNPENHPERALLHPAQQAMVDCHGSQCGFCTPGFIMSLASVYENKRMQDTKTDELSVNELSYDEIVASIAGNLCRCTGYRPIIEAGLSMQKIAQQRANEQVSAKDLAVTLATDAMATSKSDDALANNNHNKQTIAPALIEGARQLFIPQSTDELDQLLALYPKATIWAGGTDLGLTVTQNLVDHDVIIQLAAIESLKSWSVVDADSQSNNSLTQASTQAAAQTAAQTLIFGAGMSYKGMLPALEQYFPEFADLFERIASPQIRNMGTIGGNVANASPIGDLPPILLALDASIHIRHCDITTNISTDDNNSDQPFVDEILLLSEFFLDYKKTKLRAGSYVVAIHIPLMQDNQHLFIHKISKRFEDDISACLVAVRLDLSADSTTIDDVKIGLGGMAAVPLLVQNCQQALIGQPFTIASFEHAAKALPLDVSPMTDVRASREYRLHVVQRLLIKCGKQLIKGAQTEGA